MFGTTDVLRVLYREGVKVNQLNKQGGNVINCMIAVSVLETTLEEKMTEIYNFISKMLNTDELKDLLFHKSIGNMNSLEQCAGLRVLHLFTAILNTSDV